MEILVSLSALQLSQYRQYAKGWKPDPLLLEIFEKQSHKRGKKAFRIYFDYATDKDIRISDAHIPSAITTFLQQNGYQLLDYAAGTVKDKHERVTRLGKVLSKNPELKKLFDNDANRRQIVTASKGKKLVCLSMHPYDIAGMSTDRGWTSCMNLVDGVNRHYVEEEVNANTLIAYMINDDDKNINKPIMRVLLKKFTDPNSEDGSGRYIAEVVYPDSSDKMFLKKVQEWVDENINSVTDTSKTMSVLHKSNKVYNDNNSDFILSGIDTLAGKTLKQVEKVLDSVIAKLPRGRTKNLEPSNMTKIFKAAPEAILVKNISKLTMLASKLWAQSIQDNPNKLKLVDKVYADLGSRSKSVVKDRVLNALIQLKDWDSIRVAAKHIDLQEHIDSGATDDMIATFFSDPVKPVEAFELASGLANLTEDPNSNFWRILAQTTGEDSLEEIEAQEARDNFYAFHIPTFETISKIDSPFMTLESLNDAKELIPVHVVEIFNFLLGNGAKFLINFKLKDFGFNTFKERYRAWDLIEPALDAMEVPPSLKVATLNGFDSYVYLGFDEVVSKEAVMEVIEDTAATYGDNTQGYSETVAYPNCKILKNGKDLLLLDTRGREQDTLHEVMIDEGFEDVTVTIYADAKTHIPMVKYEGDADMVDQLVSEIRRLTK